MRCALARRAWCRRRESNPHDLCKSGDFESPASAIPPLRPGRGRSDLRSRHSHSNRTLRWRCARALPTIVPRTFQKTSLMSAARVGRNSWMLSIPREKSAPTRITSAWLRAAGLPGPVQELPEEERPQGEHREVSDDPDDRVHERVRQHAAAPRAHDDARDVLERSEVRPHARCRPSRVASARGAARCRPRGGSPRSSSRSARPAFRASRAGRPSRDRPRRRRAR